MFDGGNWPAYDPAKTVDETVKIAVQVNGKLRATVDMAPGSEEAEVVPVARAEDNVAKHLEGLTERRVIFVKDRLVNFVVS